LKRCESEMRVTVRVGSVRLMAAIVRVTDVVGVNSKLRDGSHIPLWDFDGVPLRDVELDLRRVQEHYNLPTIYILRSSDNDHYIAYCFYRCRWAVCKHIVSAAYNVDEQFYRYGVFRGHFTLRVSRKGEWQPHLVSRLESPVPETAGLTDLCSWVRYETLPPNYHPHSFSFERRKIS